MKKAVFVILPALVLAVAAPAAAQMGPSPARGPSSSDDVLPEVDPKIADDAQKVFEKAEEDFKRESWLSAIAHYQHVRAKFSYNLALSSQAELRLGDIAFRREHWGEARGYYRSFLRFHPTHPQADYAAFRIGLCAFREVPGDVFWQPPSNEKDQSDARAALQQMRDFVARFPRSTYVPEATAVIRECEDRLASHELYVAKFYASKEKWKGTVLRAQGLAKSFPSSPHTHEALALAIESHVKLGNLDAAQRTLDQLSGLSPKPEILARAKSALAAKAPAQGK